MSTHTPPKHRSLRALVLAMTMALLIAACGSSGTDSAEADTPTAEEEIATVTDDAVDAAPSDAAPSEEAMPEDAMPEDAMAAEATPEDAATDDAMADSDDPDDSGAAEDADNEPAADAVVAVANADYLGDYTYIDDGFGTMVTVTVDANARTIISNALPNHETGTFPNAGNPNTISEQDKTWAFSVDPTYVGTPSIAREPGVALNGIKFEPDTAERVNCTTGEEYRIEGLQDTFDLGMDFNNAHVQPTGEYHYHGVSELLVEAYASDEDLVLVGFAADGFLMYYSKSSAYASSYMLSTEPRTGTDCTYRNNTVAVDGTTPDGTYASDWDYIDGLGALDECNGTLIDGTYAYIVTEEYPFIPRCLMGDYDGGGGPSGAAPGAGAEGAGQDGAQGGPGAGGPPDLDNAASLLGIDRAALEAALGTPPPDLAAAAEALGITEAQLEAALFG